MAKTRPYFALHQIDTGKYTRGGEYYKLDGDVYVGPYHILPNDQIFTGFVPAISSVEIYTLTGELLETKFIEELREKKRANIKIQYFISCKWVMWNIHRDG